jgi:hypothetical protein
LILSSVSPAGRRRHRRATTGIRAKRRHQRPRQRSGPAKWERAARHLQVQTLDILAAAQLAAGQRLGAACDLAVTCDLAIGAPKTTFAIAPVKMGHFLGALPMHIIKEMDFTGNPLSAGRA